MKTPEFIANEKGLIVCNEYLHTIVIQGDGSVFPIFDIEDSKGPLWSYFVNFDSIEEDLFDQEHISIYLNKLHASYKFINISDDEHYNQNFFYEVLSNAMTMIIIEIRKNLPKEQIDLEGNGDEGSILKVLKYFADKLHIRVNGSYSEILSDFKKYLDKELK